uniref:Polysaccharide biosynthesis protein n=1 Tax=uncultured organism TaxID=155900 RepID=A0A7L9QCM7_9ZZZZ|nr:hypothetical protein [uncultured organism]
MKRLFASALVRDGAVAGAANLLANGGSFVYYSAAAHALGPATGGLFLALIAAALLISVFANIAGVALTPDVARLHAANDRGGVRVLAGRAALGWLASGIALIVVALALTGPGESLFHLDDPVLLIETGAVVAANALLFLTRAFVQAIARFDVYAWSNVVETILKAIAAGAIVAFPSLRLTIGSLAAVLALSALFTAWPVFAYVRRARPVVPAFAQRSGVRSLIAAFSALAVMTFADGIIARHMLAPFDAGLYNAAALAGRALMSALGFLPLVILSKLAHDREESERGDRFFYAAVGACCLGAIAIFALFPTFILIAVGGRAYVAGAPLVALYGIAASALSMTNVVVSYRISRGARTIGRVLIVIAAAELAAMLVYHPSAAALVDVLIAGHTLALVGSCLTGARPQRSRRAIDAQTGARSAGSSTT